MASLPRWVPLLVGAPAVIGIAFDLSTQKQLSATTAVMCEGAYTDTLEVESARTREIEQGPRGQYSYLVRSSARYECLFFGADGNLRRLRKKAVAHGTAFAYRQQRRTRRCS